jgi:predicted dinucleotide-binding enzyme
MSTRLRERRLGIVGAGKLGTALARAALEADYDVVISGSGPAERIRLIVEVLAPGARATTTDDVVQESDVVVLAIPAHRFRELAPDTFDGKVLIDTMNYWEPMDGVIEELETAHWGTSALVQSWFSSACVVKALNQLGYHDVDEGRRSRGARDRIAVAIAGDDVAAVKATTTLVDDIGFDPLYVGGLAEGVALEPVGPAFGVALRESELSRLLWPDAKRA